MFNKGNDIIQISTSSIISVQILVGLWSDIYALYPKIKFHLLFFENISEIAREILKNLRQNIDIVKGIFADTLLDALKKVTSKN